LLIGLPSDETPKSIGEWLVQVHTDDRTMLRRQMARAMRSGLRTVADYRLQHGNNIRHLHHVMDPLPSPPNHRARHTRWFSTLQDITSSKSAESKS
jgi:hypothetical protein